MSNRPHYLMTEIDVTETTPEERAAAARTVARYAATQDNPQGAARELLEMLGLLDDVKPKTTGCRVCGGPLPIWTLGPKTGMRGCCSRPCLRKSSAGGAE